ncbi:kinase-like protein [Aspergillus homomorphus CBS 101889]|uniref:Kinase-like protein n=1 Tax=Aspergillus homomorphus (strain CBS 101889) TaxID=1450537 RepID=A0A395I0D4_ASPHC|nr:kinase-like protein [Aspergillus homomorphus CBS 101889]RAL13195.1 kinase-like protein [Aspergillus homomorphus CBS 101889]
MAFLHWFGLHPISAFWFTFKTWIWSWVPSVQHLTSRSPIKDVEKGDMQTSSVKETSPEIHNANAKAYDYVIDAKGEFLAGGTTGIVELLDDGTALKSVLPGENMESNIMNIAKEASIYRRLGPHERLIQLLGHSEDGLVLEYMEKGNLKAYLLANSSIPTDLRLKWASQVAEAVQLLHNSRIIHCDIKPSNLLLTEALDIKIIDFAGSSVDGSRPSACEGTRFYLPRDWREQPTVATDLFALGSTIYQIFQGTSPYAEIPSDEVERLFTQKEFPDVSGIVCGDIIKKCWLSQIASAGDVRKAIHHIIDKLNC